MEFCLFLKNSNIKRVRGILPFYVLFDSLCSNKGLMFSVRNYNSQQL